MIDINGLLVEINVFLLIFARVIGLVVASPLLKHTFVPPRVGVYFTLVLSIVLYSTYESKVEILSFGHLMYFVALEFFLGLSIGLITVIAMEAFSMAGLFVANAMGLGMANILNPATGTTSPTTSNIYSLVGLITVISLGGHLVLIHWVHTSLRVIPLTEVISFFNLNEVLKVFHLTFALGISIALPAMFLLMLLTATLGMITKAAPALNIFSIGFPGTIFAGLVIISLSAFLLEVHATSAFITIQEALLGRILNV